MPEETSHDRIEKIGNSQIQHGKHNDRIYLMKLDSNDFPEIIVTLNDLANQKGYSKIFAKIPLGYGNEFFKDGYGVEARVPNFYRGVEDGLFLAKYFYFGRRKLPQKELLDFKGMVGNIPLQGEIFLDSRFRCLKPAAADAEDMSKLYGKVFPSYPFPIHEGDYLRQTMRENTVYFGIWESGELIALASAEMDLDSFNVEMTDFAVLPEYRGNQLALFLLKQMELEMKDRGMKTAYTIARLKSAAMNVTFLKSGYQYGGTLIHNTNICGGLESMNVWFKTL